MKVKYTSTEYLGIAFEKDKIYSVISVEKGRYRIMTELDEDYLFPMESFEVTEKLPAPSVRTVGMGKFLSKQC